MSNWEKTERDASQLADAPPSDTIQGVRLPDKNKPSIWQDGEVLNGTYEIRELLGRGGMGQVFEAHDRVLNRRVAIKTSLTRDPQDVSKLRKEAQALAALRHPGVATVHCMGSHGGVDYIVMERILGTSLEDHLWQRRAANQPFTLTEAVDVLTGIADCLACVHRAGMAHRDVKPSNVMLAPGNRVVLVDFGIFVPEYEMAQDHIGSPQYVAPETIRNRVDTGAWHLVDVYALGVIAFELLTGEKPFQGNTLTELLMQHLHMTPPEIWRYRKGVPAQLQAVVMEMLSKDPRDRLQSLDIALWQLRNLPKEIDKEVEEVEGAEAPRFSVLLVEDERQTRDLLRKRLEELPNTEVRTADNGERALAMVREQVPDLLLTDLEMPAMNGLELCLHLRGTNLASACAIVVMSAVASPSDVEVLKHIGVEQFITKADGCAAVVPAVDRFRRLRATPPGVVD